MIQEFPLNKVNRIHLARAFKDVPRVDMSIECVVEAQMGKAFVDDVEHPTAFKIQTGPFFYFAGSPNTAGARLFIENIQPYNLFMPSAPGWIDAAREKHGDRLVRFDRYSFSGGQLSLQHLHQLIEKTGLGDQAKQMDLNFARQLWGRDHFVDISDFDSAEDFSRRGIGFYMDAETEVIGAAYASLVCSKGIEVSLFVAEEHRRKGIATVLSSYLVKWCLENNTSANWDAANLESCKLAEKLGYTPIGKYDAYYLKEQKSD